MNFLRTLFDPQGLTAHLWNMLYTLPGILLGLTLHELAHAYAADRLGDPTPRNMGRLTLNPLKHIDPLGFLMLLIAGFGWAKPVMTNPNYYRRRRYGFAIVGLAGPVTNFLLGFVLLFVGYALVMRMGVDAQSRAMNVLWGAVSINFALFVFNLIPIPPLDGFGILKDTLLIKYANTQALWTLERYGSLLMLALLFTNIASTIIGFTNNYLWQFGMWVAERIL